MLIEVLNLVDATSQLKDIAQPVGLINAQGTIYTFGMRGVHHLFSKLKQEFSNISYSVLSIEDSTPAFFTALSLGYREMIYTGKLSAIINIAQKYNVRLYSHITQFHTQ